MRITKAENNSINNLLYIMTKNATITTWVVIILVIIVVGGIWWYYAANNNTNNNGTTNNQTQTQSSAKSITTFSFQQLNPQVSGAIDQSAHTISVTVPKDTNVTQLTPTISTSDYATVSPLSGVVQDFTNPVTYTVRAQDGSTQNYTVTVTKAAQ